MTKLGEWAAELGDFDRAEAQIREGLALAHKLGHIRQITIAQYGLAKLLLARREFAQAEQLFAASCELARRQNNVGSQALALGGLGLVAFWRGDPCARGSI